MITRSVRRVARVLIFVGMVLPAALRAEDWTAVDGKSYKSVQVLSHDDGYVTILDADGGAKLMLTELPPALRARFGFDPAKAAACVAATEAADEKEQEAEAQAKQPLPAVAGSRPATTLIASAQTASPIPNAMPFSDLVPAASLPSGTLLEDGNFIHGDAVWKGDGFPAPGGHGVVVKLNSTAWTRVYQTFSSTTGANYSITVTYRFAPGIAPSDLASDYADISKKLGVPGFDTYSSLSLTPGDFYGTIGDPNKNLIAMELYRPNLKSTNVQTYQHSYPRVPPSPNSTFILAFPPGQGMVEILSAAVTCQ
jgi:hypothetical protein